MKNRKHLSTTAVARLLGVAVGSVAKWIDKDELRAGRTPALVRLRAHLVGGVKVLSKST